MMRRKEEHQLFPDAQTQRVGTAGVRLVKFLAEICVYGTVVSDDRGKTWETNRSVN
jgi:hypothetical protein